MGTISIVGSAQEATQKIINRQPLMFRVTFPFRNPIPKLVRIVYDENLLCTGPGGEFCGWLKLQMNLFEFAVQTVPSCSKLLSETVFTDQIINRMKSF